MAGLWVIFHPLTKKGAATLVVARVQRRSGGLVTYPTPELRQREDAALLLEKLAFLLRSEGNALDALPHLESQFWSFVPSAGDGPPVAVETAALTQEMSLSHNRSNQEKFR